MGRGLRGGGAAAGLCHPAGRPQLFSAGSLDSAGEGDALGRGVLQRERLGASRPSTTFQAAPGGGGGCAPCPLAQLCAGLWCSTQYVSVRVWEPPACPQELFSPFVPRPADQPQRPKGRPAHPLGTVAGVGELPRPCLLGCLTLCQAVPRPLGMNAAGTGWGGARAPRRASCSSTASAPLAHSLGPHPEASPKPHLQPSPAPRSLGSSAFRPPSWERGPPSQVCSGTLHSLSGVAAPLGRCESSLCSVKAPGSFSPLPHTHCQARAPPPPRPGTCAFTCGLGSHPQEVALVSAEPPLAGLGPLGGGGLLSLP